MAVYVYRRDQSGQKPMLAKSNTTPIDSMSEPHHALLTKKRILLKTKLPKRKSRAGRGIETLKNQAHPWKWIVQAM
jgi:hypothetical protein